FRLMRCYAIQIPHAAICLTGPIASTQRHPVLWRAEAFWGSALPAASKSHRDLVRAVLSARIAYSVGVGALATGADVIGVAGDVGHSGNQHAVTINVDVVR